MDATKIAELRAFLEGEATRLHEELSELERDSATNLSEGSGENNYRDHMADQGSATFGKELGMVLEGNVRELLSQVERALSRFDSGDYGKCVRCGEDIAMPRLEAMPAAELCITCKEWEEGR